MMLHVTVKLVLIIECLKKKNKSTKTCGKIIACSSSSSELIIDISAIDFRFYILVPECGYGHFFFLWDRKQQKHREAEEEGAEKHKVRKAQMTNDPSAGQKSLKHKGPVRGKLQKYSEDQVQEGQS